MGVTINKRKATGDWYVWISQNGKRTSRKIGKDKATAMKAATMYRKQLALNTYRCPPNFSIHESQDNKCFFHLRSSFSLDKYGIKFYIEVKVSSGPLCHLNWGTKALERSFGENA